jgi:thioredoxin 1
MGSGIFRKSSQLYAVTAARTTAALAIRRTDFIYHCTFSKRHLGAETIMSDNITHVTDASFDADVLKSGTPVLVDFWAEWCGPCKMIAPVLEEVAVSHAGKVKIAKVDVDDNREIAAKYGIRGIPTLMIFKNGELAAQKVGALSKAQLTAFVDSNV